MKIELDAPNVGVLEKEYLNKVIEDGFVSTFGPYISDFESKIADYTGAKAAVAVQSGTAAIYMALHELGIGQGDEVIVPALTFAATVNPVLMVGATPVIVDVDLKTWNIDPDCIKKSITSQTKAIIPVHLYGNPCAMNEIIDIAKENNLYVIEDATESLGAQYDGVHTGIIGDFGCFSFNGNKLITTGGGGMIVSKQEARMEHIRYLINQAKDQNAPGCHSEMGFNYRMTNIEAAMGMAQFEQIEKFLQQKKRFREIYQESLGILDCVKFPKEEAEALGCCWFSCLRVAKPIELLGIIQKLKSQGIPTRKVFMPLGDMPYLKEYAKACPNAKVIFDSGICLPSSTLNTEKGIQKTSFIIKEVLSE